MLGLIAIAGFIAAFIAINRFSDSTREYGRKPYSIFVTMYLAPLIVGGVYDFVRLEHTNLPPLTWFSQLIIPYLALLSYPLFQRIMWRINDCGSRKWVAYLCLIPYLNIFPLIYLMMTKTRESEVVE